MEKKELTNPSIIRLKKYLDENGIKQNFIAKELGCSNVMICLWFKGVNPRKNWTKTITQYLDNAHIK